MTEENKGNQERREHSGRDYDSSLIPAGPAAILFTLTLGIAMFSGLYTNSSNSSLDCRVEAERNSRNEIRKTVDPNACDPNVADVNSVAYRVNGQPLRNYVKGQR